MQSLSPIDTNKTIFINHITLIVATSIKPGVASIFFFKSNSRYSKTMVSYLSVITTSISRSMLGWESSLRIPISRMVVLGLPSS